MPHHSGIVTVPVDLTFFDGDFINPLELDFDCSFSCDNSCHPDDPSNGGEEFEITYMPHGNAPAWLSDVIIEMAKVKAQDYFMNNLERYRG